MNPCRRPTPVIPLEWHQRVCHGDPVVIEEVAAKLLLLLTGSLRKRFPQVDPALIDDAVVDAILDYTKNPNIFDPQRGAPLPAFLHLLAHRRILSLVRSERRRKSREQRVALDQPATYLFPEGTIDADVCLIAALNLFTNQKDRRLFRLWLNGERSTEQFAAVLGISDMSATEQLREVKRARDRIFKRLRRAGRQLAFTLSASLFGCL